MKNSYNSISKKQTIQLKRGRVTEYTFSKRRHTDGKKAYEKMLNITNHQENANQNHSEISPPTCQNGFHQKDQR